MSVQEDIRELYFGYRRDLSTKAPTRVILGASMRRALLAEMTGLDGMVYYRQPYPDDKKERFMGLEILVDYGDDERVTIE